MASLILFSLIVLLAISLPLSVVHCTGGFSSDLIHRDSPGSPHHNSSLSPADRVRFAARRSIARASRFRKSTIDTDAKAAAAAKDSTPLQSEIKPDGGDYLMTINVGTPPLKILAIGDTGSDLIWTQCKPCAGCFKQNGPIFDPTTSSTYGTVSCNASSCSALSPSERSCSNSSSCLYTYGYGDKSYTNGTLSSETFTFDSESLTAVSTPNIRFGCAQETGGNFSEHGAGLVGLGRGPLSLVSQLGPSINNKFSYFLVPYTDENNSTSLLHFGDKADVAGLPKAVTTPIVKGDVDTFYYLSLEDISIGNKQVGIGAGKIIIDSGTTFTLLDKARLQQLVQQLSETVEYPVVRDSSGTFEFCFDVSSSLLNGVDLQLPELTFQFSGAPMTLPPLNTFVLADEGVMCLAILLTDEDGLGIFGNIAQQNWHVGYDLGAKKLSFAPGSAEDQQPTGAVKSTGESLSGILTLPFGFLVCIVSVMLHGLF